MKSTEIGFNAFKDCTDLMFKCSKGSYAEKYAKEHDIPCEIIKKAKANTITDMTLDKK